MSDLDSIDKNDGLEADDIQRNAGLYMDEYTQKLQIISEKASKRVFLGSKMPAFRRTRCRERECGHLLATPILYHAPLRRFPR